MERRNHLKLFVWTDFCPDYTSGLAFAIAKDEKEARKMITEARGFTIYSWGELHTFPLHKKIAFAVSGGG